MDNSTLIERLLAYSQAEDYPYHMPGHKRHAKGRMPAGVLSMDITEIEGFDNLHRPQGILLEEQKRAAALYGAEETFYLVNGSTSGILSAVSAAVPRGGRILMARNCHKSAYHAVYLRSLETAFLYPETVKGFDICEAVTAGQVEEALERTEAAAVLIVSPTYEGRLADVGAIAAAAHRRGIPLIVDEAHGAHLGLAEGFAPNSCSQGADLVIHSVHKTLPAMTQSALLHVNGSLIDRGRLKRFLRIYQSTSPSYVLMASISDAVNTVIADGEALFAELYRNWMEMMRALSACRALRVLGPGERQDIGKLMISAFGTGLSGRQLSDILSEKYHLRTELYSLNTVLAMFTVGDTREGFQRMTEALLEIDGWLADGMAKRSGLAGKECAAADSAFEKNRTAGEWSEVHPAAPAIRLQRALSLEEAWESPAGLLPLAKCEGRIAGDFILPYPPGTPLAVPGERLTGELIAYVESCVKARINVEGIESKDGESCLKVLMQRD